MGAWNLYFTVALVLHCTGRIALNPWLNLLLAAAALAPAQLPVWRWLRVPVLVIAAGALLYYESFLPPLESLLREANGLSGFSTEYLSEILGRTIDPRLVLWCAALLAAGLALRQWLRISAFVVLALLVVPLVPLSTPAGAGIDAGAASAGPSAAAATADEDGETLITDTQPAALDAAVQRFFDEEAHRTLAFPRLGRDLDLIILHICSLSWDDLRASGLLNHPLFGRFDVLFDRFNSAASYSGPAAIRLLRGTCGQSRHDALYDTASEDCLLVDRLQAAGFQPQLLMNHDGHYGHFRADLARHGGLEVDPQPSAGARVALRAFDGSPIGEDYDVLHGWWQRHRAAHASRVALYYNTISLHDGNRAPDDPGGWVASYPGRARRLLDDLAQFVDEVRASGAPAIIVFIPEHGAAVHAAPGQIAGLRQIPGPNITEVPVGLFLSGLNVNAPLRPMHVEASTSYLGLNEVLANLMAAANSPSGRIDLAEVLARPLVLPFVAENDGILVVRAGDGYRTRQPNGRWSP